MPFNGLTSFLRKINQNTNGGEKLYQCPLTGLLHFYQNAKLDLDMDDVGINAL